MSVGPAETLGAAAAFAREAVSGAEMLSREAVGAATAYTRDVAQRVDARVTAALNVDARPAFRTEDGGASIRVVHTAQISPKFKKYLCCYGALNPCSCVPCNIEFVLSSTYAQIHENRVEINYPARPSLRGILWRWINTYLHPCQICSCGEIRDDVQVFYFDKISGAGRARCCMPVCTHWTCCPTCGDRCGQGAVIYDDDDCHVPCFCREWVLVPGLADAKEFLAQLKAARAAWKERQKAYKAQQAAAPSPAVMMK